MDRAPLQPRLRRGGFPHPRGDGPRFGFAFVGFFVISPPAWGWTAATSSGVSSSADFPTRVGMDRRDSPACFFVGRFPHPREPLPTLCRSSHFRAFHRSASLKQRRRTAAGRHSHTFHHSHSMLAGGLVEMSYSTRLMPFTSLRILWLVSRRICGGSSTQSAVIASSETTARSEIAHS